MVRGGMGVFYGFQPVIIYELASADCLDWM